MDQEAQEQISRYINPTERILWTGRPKTGIVFRTSEIFITVFALLWLTVITWLLYLAFVYGDIRAILSFSPFAAMTLYLLFGRHIHDAWRRSRTFYGLTDQRVIIISGWFRSTMSSIPLRSLRCLKLREKSNGSGSIYFGSACFAWIEGMYWPGMSNNAPPVIELIDNVRGVHDRILAARLDC